MFPLLIFWFLWCARNSCKHQGVLASSQKIIGQVIHFVQFRQVNKMLNQDFWKGDSNIRHIFGLDGYTLKTQRIISIIWRKLDIGWYKLNCDGAAKGNLGRTSAGGLIRDYNGNVLCAFIKFLDNKSNKYA